MTAVNSRDELARNLNMNLRRSGRGEEAARSIGNNLDDLEKRLLDAYSDPNATTNQIKSLEVQYQRATRTMEGFMQMMRNMHEMIMKGISYLRLN